MKCIQEVLEFDLYNVELMVLWFRYVLCVAVIVRITLNAVNQWTILSFAYCLWVEAFYPIIVPWIIESISRFPLLAIMDIVNMLQIINGQVTQTKSKLQTYIHLLMNWLRNSTYPINQIRLQSFVYLWR